MKFALIVSTVFMSFAALAHADCFESKVDSANQSVVRYGQQLEKNLISKVEFDSLLDISADGLEYAANLCEALGHPVPQGRVLQAQASLRISQGK